MRPLALALVALAFVVGCRASDPESHADDDDTTRIVSRPLPPEPARPRRIELVETAVLASSTDASREVEISLALASTDPGAQSIDSMLVRITPERPYEVVSDERDNRFLKLHVKGPEGLTVELTYQVELSTASVDLTREEIRPLTPNERVLLRPEIDLKASAPDGASFLKIATAVVTKGRPWNDNSIWEDEDHIRKRGVPARAVCGFSLLDGGHVDFEAWPEAYVPGLGWVPFLPTRERGGCTTDLRLVYARGVRISPRVVTVEGRTTRLPGTCRWREAPQR